ncbi:MAG: hypothetical protein ABL900_00040 [Burkholderiaceae bacterium]
MRARHPTAFAPVALAFGAVAATATWPRPSRRGAVAAMRSSGWAWTVVLAGMLPGCGGGGGGGAAPPAVAASYSVGGNVGGLTGTVVLQNNGGDALSLSTNSGFVFSAAVPDGGSYALAVLTQPAGQTCSVSNGSGTVNGGNVINVSVTCTTESTAVRFERQRHAGMG